MDLRVYRSRATYRIVNEPGSCDRRRSGARPLAIHDPLNQAAPERDACEGVVLTVLLVTVVGVIASWDVLMKKPLGALREQ